LFGLIDGDIEEIGDKKFRNAFRVGWIGDARDLDGMEWERGCMYM
jgi:hypothetical protein